MEKSSLIYSVVVIDVMIYANIVVIRLIYQKQRTAIDTTGVKIYRIVETVFIQKIL